MLQDLLASPERQLPFHWANLQDQKEVLATPNRPALRGHDVHQVGAYSWKDEDARGGSRQLHVVEGVHEIDRPDLDERRAVHLDG